jgi:DNA polymerase-3 subunit delta'
VLVSARPDALLPTVRSRCAVLRFGRLPASDVAAVLVSAHGYSAGDAHAVAAVSDGSVGRALQAAAADSASAREAAHQVLSAAARSSQPRARLDLAKDLLPKRTSSTITEREYLSVHLRAMSSLLRDIGIAATGADPAAMANSDLQDGVERLSSAFAADRAVRAFAAVDQALGAIERNASPKTVADWLVLQL